MRSQENDIVSSSKAIVETYVAANATRLLPIGQLKDYNKIPIQNGKNFKANCDIDEVPEVRFPPTI